MRPVAARWCSTPPRWAWRPARPVSATMAPGCSAAAGSAANRSPNVPIRCAKSRPSQFRNAARLLGRGDVVHVSAILQRARVPDQIGVLPDREVAGETAHVRCIEDGAARPLLDIAVVCLDLVLATQIRDEVRQHEIMIAA